MKENSLQVFDEIQDKAGFVFNWFSGNYFKANPKKPHFLLTSNEQVNLNLDDLIIKTSKSEKLLGINIYHFLTFNKHVSKLRKKASQKLHAIARISRYLSKNKLRLIMNALFSSQFGYCPLVWMFHNRRHNNKINPLHEGMLRIVYKDYKSSFAELLSEDKSFTVHHKNVQKLAIEMYKIKNEFKCVISGTQLDYKKITRSAIIVEINTKDVRLVKTNISSLRSKRHLQSISLFT